MRPTVNAPIGKRRKIFGFLYVPLPLRLFIDLNILQAKFVAYFSSYIWYFQCFSSGDHMSLLLVMGRKYSTVWLNILI